MHMVSAMVIAAGACNSLSTKFYIQIILSRETNFTHLGLSKYNLSLSNFYQLLFQIEIETKYYTIVISHYRKYIQDIKY